MTAPPTRDWHPARTWVAVVGTLEWQNKEMFDSFPKEKRRDAALVGFFQQAGVPAAQIVYLCDRQAHYAQIARTLPAHFAQARPGDFLFVYYCGHGYKLDSGAACLACYDAGAEGCPDWQMASLPALIEQHFPGDHALLAADCCYSGCLADAVTAHRGRVSYACLTSSLASESSTGNWTFTEGLLAGLQGQAFADADDSSTITLQELAAQILADLAFADEQLASFVTTGAFNPQMVLAPARRKPDPQVGHRVEVHAEGAWYRAQIIAAADDQFKVHYYGWETTDDEWVTPDRMRQVIPVEYPVGTAVEVKWKRHWYPATVQAVQSGIHHIQYDSYDATWNEWVAGKRIRLPQG